MKFNYWWMHKNQRNERKLHGENVVGINNLYISKQNILSFNWEHLLDYHYFNQGFKGSKQGTMESMAKQIVRFLYPLFFIHVPLFFAQIVWKPCGIVGWLKPTFRLLSIKTLKSHNLLSFFFTFYNFLNLLLFNVFNSRWPSIVIWLRWRTWGWSSPFTFVCTLWWSFVLILFSWVWARSWSFPVHWRSRSRSTSPGWWPGFRSVPL